MVLDPRSLHVQLAGRCAAPARRVLELRHPIERGSDGLVLRKRQLHLNESLRRNILHGSAWSGTKLVSSLGVANWEHQASSWLLEHRRTHRRSGRYTYGLGRNTSNKVLAVLHGTRSPFRWSARHMFGSVTTTVTGWTNGNYGPNRDVVNGFLSKLASLAAHEGAILKLGIYAAQDSGFGTKLDASSWTPSEPIVVWIASWQSSTTCSTVEGLYCPMPTIGGYFPMIWQYHGDPDYNVTPYEGFKTNGYWTPTKPPGIC